MSITKYWKQVKDLPRLIRYYSHKNYSIRIMYDNNIFKVIEKGVVIFESGNKNAAIVQYKVAVKDYIVYNEINMKKGGLKIANSKTN